MVWLCFSQVVFEFNETAIDFNDGEDPDAVTLLSVLLVGEYEIHHKKCGFKKDKLHNGGIWDLFPLNVARTFIVQ